MSLTSFLALPEVVAELKRLRPKGRRTLGLPRLAEPRSARTNVVGIAFDYLLRFELQRHGPHAVVRPWVAEHVPAMLDAAHVGGLDLMVLSPDGPPTVTPPRGGFRKAARRATDVVRAAREAVQQYHASDVVSAEERASLAAHALRLAKLDLVFRAHRLDPRFAEADPEDVDDLLALLEIVPLPALLDSTTLHLNPIFGDSSAAVGGADTDLITGDLLVDIKTVKEATIRADHLDQLLGYFLLARREHERDPSFPQIGRVGLYFARHGHLWIVDAAEWTTHPEFAAVEEWFFEAAAEVLAEEEGEDVHA